MDKVQSQMQTPKCNHPVVIKGNVLLHCHLLRIPLEGELAENLRLWWGIPWR